MLIVRPSSKSTMSESLSNRTPIAAGTLNSIREIVIPCLQKEGLVLFYQFLNFSYFMSTETFVVLQSNRY